MSRSFFQEVISLANNHPDDLVRAVEASEHYLKKHAELAAEISDVSGSIEKWASRIAGLTEYCFRQLQDLESILDHLESKEKKTKSKVYIKYTEHYQRSLSHQQITNYIDSDSELQDIRIVIQQVANARNLFLGLMKGFDALNYQLSNITKLRVVGLEDATLV